MKLIEINWNPTPRQLRQFGRIALAALPLLGWLWGATAQTIAVLAAVGLLLALLSALWPTGLRPLFVALSLLTAPVGLVVGELAMLLIYFGLFLPLGLAFRLLGRDALERRLQPEVDTYWQPKATPADTARYYRQF